MFLKKTYRIFLLAFALPLFAQWTPTGGGDHGGANWFPSDGDSIAGIHTGIDTFRIHPSFFIPIKHHDGADFGFLDIEAAAIIIEGELNAVGAGHPGGAGGISTSAISPRYRRGGRAGEAGEGISGGCPGDTGYYGGAVTTPVGQAWGGGGGAGGGRGGGYGGASCNGGTGGSGNCVDLWPYFASGGAAGIGGSGAGTCPSGTDYTYGTSDGNDIDMGSGGGGAGGGGNSGNTDLYGDSGAAGGAGGGMIRLVADTIYISGLIIVDGTAGGPGGDGGDGDYYQGDAAGGGGGGAGGGSGGGIFLKAPKMQLASSALLSLMGGNGGSGGDMGSGGPPGSCGAGGDGGAGGGGGRIKIIYDDSYYSNEATIISAGGVGGASGD